MLGGACLYAEDHAGDCSTARPSPSSSLPAERR